ncbi:MAG TPA: sigma-70 family RNA polymerase sigma factor [Streptosporangiaceae bacterium]|nr:sigma-70 family RNA polymerase sigma factor [Streptosporangiaceae bacterium]
MNDDEARHRFTAMYDAHRTQVWAFTACLAGRERADDLVSDTFVVAWRRFGDIPDPALPWLLGVARNIVRQHVRAQVRQGSLESELRAWAETDTPIHPAEAAAARVDILRALARLPEKDREVLILTAWQELTPHETALVIGVTPTAIRVRLHRARRRFAATLGTIPPQQPQPRQTQRQPARRDTR